MQFCRGGVEDTRLEAKAKDTKKIRGQGQGQGQPVRGQTLSRPRTGMLEAKAKDQGHKAQVLSKKKKKKVFTKIFQANSKKKKKKKKKKRSSQKFFKRSPLKNPFQKIFQPLHKILTFQKVVLSSSRGQANFRGLEASRPRPRPRTSKCVLEDVLEDSTSAILQSWRPTGGAWHNAPINTPLPVAISNMVDVSLRTSPMLDISATNLFETFKQWRQKKFGKQ